MDATAAIIPALRFSAPTPFESHREAPAQDDDEPEESEEPSKEEVSDVDKTNVVEVLRFDTLPFGRGGPESNPKAVGGLTLDQYASLCVELALYPENKPRILKRYHLRGEPDFNKINQKWNNVIATSPDARARFQDTFAAYRTHLRAHPLDWSAT